MLCCRVRDPTHVTTYSLGQDKLKDLSMCSNVNETRVWPEVEFSRKLFRKIISRGFLISLLLSSPQPRIYVHSIDSDTPELVVHIEYLKVYAIRSILYYTLWYLSLHRHWHGQKEDYCLADPQLHFYISIILMSASKCIPVSNPVQFGFPFPSMVWSTP